jgi:hypothetical protein
LGPQAIIQLADRAMRPEIRQHRKIDATHLFSKSFMGKWRVNANAQHLSISSLEFFSILFEAAQLPLSASRKIEWIKRQDHVLLPAVVVQRNILLA